MLKFGTIFLALVGLTLAVPTEDKVKPEPRNGCQYSYNFVKAGQKAYLQSPNWPNTYTPNSNCKYSLTSPSGTRIVLNCEEFNVEHSNGCVYDRFRVSLSGDPAMTDGKNICGQGTFNQTSNGNSLIATFTSDAGNPPSRSIFRFQCLLTIVEANSPPATVAPVVANPPPSASFSDQTCSCGTRNENTRIVGGTFAGVNEFPWRAAMYSPNLGVFCGATIISPSYVLTAAHCTAALKKSDVLYADIGDHDLTTVSEADNQVIKCDKIIQHAQYNNDTQDNDVALCHLEKPLTYSRTVQPVCLPWSMVGQDFQGATVTASGWGTTSSGGNSATTLKKVDLPIKTTQECQRYYQDAITDNMICTYSAGKDTCQGDSGGSIDYKDPKTGKHICIGVVSWGVGCAGVNQPGVYAKVTNYLQWILSNTSGEQFCR